MVVGDKELPRSTKTARKICELIGTGTLGAIKSSNRNPSSPVIFWKTGTNCIELWKRE
jgi:hypothetical protein